VGGGETVPEAFRADYGLRGMLFEWARDIGRWMGDHDPLVHRTARKSAVALATTPNAALRLARVGARDVRVITEAALDGAEADLLGRLPAPEAVTANGEPFRFVSLGRLRHFKGYHLAVEAFARAGLPDAEYWVIGDGPERPGLEQLAGELGVGERVRFWGELPRAQALERLANCAVLVHPSLRESGGWVCLEGMAAGRPVICLDLGGPAVQVPPEAGFRIPATTPEVTVARLAEAMRRLAGDADLVRTMGRAGREHVRMRHVWGERIAEYSGFYDEAIGAGADATAWDE
jgi:glycosyltransferase involved in cell wall biosynthesis